MVVKVLSSKGWWFSPSAIFVSFVVIFCYSIIFTCFGSRVFLLNVPHNLVGVFSSNRISTYNAFSFISCSHFYLLFARLLRFAFTLTLASLYSSAELFN